jgi:two-component system OmpR family response regulator
MTAQARIDSVRAHASGLESFAMSQKILVIEDDRTTADFIVKGLTGQGFLVDHVADGRDGLFHATDGSYDAIVLDRMLPGMDGMAILAAMRAARIATPVIILSSLGAVDARVEGLTSGADDYLTKPFAFSELVARLKLLMARPSSGAAAETVLKCEDLEMNLLNRRVTRAGKRVDLQPREFRLLEYLLRHKDQVVTRTMMLEGVWEYHFDPGTNVVDVHVSRLRRKVDDGFGKPLVHTIRGAGYMLGNPD